MLDEASATQGRRGGIGDGAFTHLNGDLRFDDGPMDRVSYGPGKMFLSPESEVRGWNYSLNAPS